MQEKCGFEGYFKRSRFCFFSKSDKNDFCADIFNICYLQMIFVCFIIHTTQHNFCFKLFYNLIDLFQISFPKSFFSSQ